MRDAFGGTFMIKLMLIFLAIYIAFVAVALNYAKAFRVKNGIIDIIEQNEGINDTDWNDKKDSSVIGKINTYLNQVSYYVKTDEIVDNNLHCYNNGYCIEEFSGVDDSKYYKITTYIKIDLPIFGLNFPIAITGETRKIERINA